MKESFAQSLKWVLVDKGGSFHSRLRQELSYDPGTGKFAWLRDSHNKQRLSGQEAGGKDCHGYIKLKFLGKTYLAHRLAWFWVTGKWPVYEVDHRNGVKNDNRWTNLREANAVQQRANAKLNKDSTSGFRGVYFNKRRGKWRAHIQRRHLGYFSSKEEAAAAVSVEFDRCFGAEFRRSPDAHA